MLAWELLKADHQPAVRIGTAAAKPILIKFRELKSMLHKTFIGFVLPKILACSAALPTSFP
jgi:hypothetical protein